jgi:hypothetical protein
MLEKRVMLLNNVQVDLCEQQTGKGELTIQKVSLSAPTEETNGFVVHLSYIHYIYCSYCPCYAYTGDFHGRCGPGYPDLGAASHLPRDQYPYSLGPRAALRPLHSAIQRG